MNDAPLFSNVSLHVLPHVVSVHDRLHDEGELIVAVVEHIFLHRHRTPAVYASQAHLHFVDAEVRETVLLQVGRMPVVLCVAVIKHFCAVLER